MTRILLRDLEPGRTYYVQARQNNGHETSQWSHLLEVDTIADTMPPAAPTALSWVTEGTAFKAVWTGPTTNQDSTPLFDFRDFEVKIYSPAAPIVVATYYVTSARHDFTFEANLNAFGVPRAQVNIEVRARDNTGNLSTAATATATNPAPADVTGFSVVGISDAISVRWTANTDDDLREYRVFQGTAFGAENNLVYTGLGTGFVFDTVSTNPQYFKIVAVDVFGTESVTPATGNATARSTLSVDNTPPAAPTGVTVISALDASDPSGGRAYIDVSWTGVADTDLQNYSIRYSTTTDWQYINVPEGTTTVRINGLRPDTAYNVAVAAVDFVGNSSAYSNAGTYPITTTKDTTAPSAPTGVTTAAGVTTMTISWDENSESDVKNGVGTYEIQLDTVNTFDSINLITKQTGGTVVSFSNLTSNTTYYTRVRAIDASLNTSSYSSIVSGTPRYLVNADIQAGTISGDKITAATINGDRVIANTLDANVLKANTVFAQNLTVGSTFTMNSSGIMRSSNYVAGVSGWRLIDTSLEINQGTIKAAALELQDGNNILQAAYADFEFAPSWYTGKMFTFNDGGTTTASISDASDVAGRFNTQCLKHNWVGGGTFSRVYQSPNATTYSVPCEQNTDYIFSGYLYNKTGSGDKIAGLGVKLADGSFVNPVVSTTILANNTWTRVSGTFNTGANSSFLTFVRLQTMGDLYYDGLQVERKIAGSNTASQWKPPGSTSIDGAIIRTGEIRSTASASGLGGQPAWSINVQGNAQFGDAAVRGRLVVGDITNPSGDGVNSKIQSSNYSAGTTGWVIRNDGFAEFSDAVIRGTVHVGNSSDYVDVTLSPNPKILLGTSNAFATGPASLSFPSAGSPTLILKSTTSAGVAASEISFAPGFITITAETSGIVMNADISGADIVMNARDISLNANRDVIIHSRIQGRGGIMYTRTVTTPGLTNVETAHVTTPAFDFLVGRAYRITYHYQGSGDTANDHVGFRIRRGTALGNSLFDSLRTHRLSVAGAIVNGESSQIVSNQTGSTLNTAIVGTYYLIGTGLIQGFANAANPVWITVEDIGVAADYPGIKAL